MSIKRLESLIEVRLSIIHKKPRAEVLDKYLKYLNEYDNMENKGIKEKLEHREIFRAYLRYTEIAKE